MNATPPMTPPDAHPDAPPDAKNNQTLHLAVQKGTPATLIESGSGQGISGEGVSGRTLPTGNGPEEEEAALASATDSGESSEIEATIKSLIEWLLKDGRNAVDVPELLDAYCRRLTDVGVPLVRSALGIALLHPQIRTLNHYWRIDRPQIETVKRAHGMETTEEYRNSPIATIIEEKAEALRFRLEKMQPPYPYPVLIDFKAQGITDYVMMVLYFSGGRRNHISFGTKRPGGFTSFDLAVIDRSLAAFGTVLETLTLKRLAATVLDTYVGRQTGLRILSGDIRRGTGDNVRAVLWYCDLRGFTSLADRLPREELISLLNGYFEIMGGAVEARGGEILKFIGDAMLAIFPLDSSDTGSRACTKALDAAEDALAGMQTHNAERASWGQPTMRSGIALHLGEVMYGNIGAPTRLDFTVIGPAVNLVSRIEGLCKILDKPVLTSAAFAAISGNRLISAGAHPVRGLPDPVEVFGLKKEIPNIASVTSSDHHATGHGI